MLRAATAHCRAAMPASASVLGPWLAGKAAAVAAADSSASAGWATAAKASGTYGTWMQAG